MKDFLPKVIGQNQIKKTLNLFLQGMTQTGFLPNMFLEGSAGGGKSYLAREIAIAASQIEQARTGNKRPFHKVNARQIAKANDFANFIATTVAESYGTVFIDEAHALPSGITDSLLTMLELNPSRKGYFSTGAGELESKYEIDFTKVSFIFATTERNLIFHALLDRLKEICLEEYSNVDLAVMLDKQVPDIDIEDSALLELVTYCRMNGRATDKMAENVIAYCAAHGVNKFRPKDLKPFIDVMGLNAMGLTTDEIRILEILKKNASGSALRDIASAMNKPAASIQSMEKYLLRKGLMRIDGKRFLTREGVMYLSA